MSETFGMVTRRGLTRREVEAYLPSNYRVVWTDDEYVIIAGSDSAGWTFDGYVQPRLQSGLFGCRRLTDSEYSAVKEYLSA